MIDHPTCIAMIGGLTVLFGVYAVVRLLRFLADIVILCIALACAGLGCTMHLWYATAAANFGFLPPDFGPQGWAICVGILTGLGVLLALPIAAFSASLGQRIRPDDRHRPNPQHRSANQQQAARSTHGTEPALYQWDNVNDRI